MATTTTTNYSVVIEEETNGTSARMWQGCRVSMRQQIPQVRPARNPQALQAHLPR